MKSRTSNLEFEGFGHLCRVGLALVALALVAGLTSGCGTIQGLRASLRGDEIPRTTGLRFSENDNVRPQSDARQYRRMNRGRLEDESELAASAGSLWVMEGQGAYLFAQNRQRIVGDILPVRIEGEPRQQLQSKARVITRLVERLENPRRESAGDAANRQPATAEQEGAQTAGAAAQAGQGASDQGNPAAPQGAPAANSSGFGVGVVPTRIIEQLRDGSYRVRGTQPFMIGKREYRVIVTGIVRPEDFDDSGIDSSRLLDSQFDIVSAKRSSSQ